MKLHTFSFVLKKYTPFIMVGLLFALLASSIPFLTNAQAGTTYCTVRATITAEEATQLMGRTTGVIAAGQYPLSETAFIKPGDMALFCLYSLIKYFANLVFFVLGALAILFFGYAAFLFITSGGNPAKRGKAQSFMLYATVGILIAALAKVIPMVVKGVIGVGTN